MGDVPALTVPRPARELQNVQTCAASVLTGLQATPVHSRERAVPLLPGRLAIPRDDPGGDPAAVLDLDPLTPRTARVDRISQRSLSSPDDYIGPIDAVHRCVDRKGVSQKVPFHTQLVVPQVVCPVGGQLRGEPFEWQVPGLLLSVPGLLLVLVVGLQLIGGLAWLPVVRRRLGSFQLRPGSTRAG